MASDRIGSLSELAVAMEVSQKTAGTWRDRGMPWDSETGGRLGLILKWLQQECLGPFRHSNGDGNDESESKAEASRRKMVAEADFIEVKTKILAGQYIDADEAQRFYNRTVAIAREQIENQLPHRLLEKMPSTVSWDEKRDWLLHAQKSCNAVVGAIRNAFEAEIGRMEDMKCSPDKQLAEEMEPDA